MELGGAKANRFAALDAGFPVTTTYRSINRQCASSLEAISAMAASIQTGIVDIGIAAGTESMTKNYGTRAIPADLSPHLKQSPVQDARDCIMPMLETSENVSTEYNISRQRQDEFAVRSHQKAAKAQKEGWFQNEIVPIKVRYAEKLGTEGTEAEGMTPKVVEKLVEHDEGIRPNATIESMGNLKPAYRADGASTAGNSSQISDGASAITLTRRSIAEKLGLKPIARFCGTAVVGVPPRVMGIGPAFAVPALLQRYGLSIDDIDLFEINEAFASQALMTLDHLKLDESKVNLKGGAIALGHPLGATGARLVTTLVNDLHRTGKQVGVATLCLGTGFGKATLVVAE